MNPSQSTPHLNSIGPGSPQGKTSNICLVIARLRLCTPTVFPRGNTLHDREDPPYSLAVVQAHDRSVTRMGSLDAYRGAAQALKVDGFPLVYQRGFICGSSG